MSRRCEAPVTVVIEPINVKEGEAMTTPADILEALGRHTAAATLRWVARREDRDLRETELVIGMETELQRLEDEVTQLRSEREDSPLGQLERMLCKRCRVRWDGVRGL